MKDRLIELLNDISCKTDCACSALDMGRCSHLDILDRCQIDAIAEHLLASGVIIPSCRAGQTVWVIDNFRKFTKPILESRKVLSVQYYKSGAIQYHYKDGSFYKEHIGITVFLTREAAEQALKGGTE